MSSSPACWLTHEQTLLGRRWGPEQPCCTAASAWAPRASRLVPPLRQLLASGQHLSQSPPQGQETSGLPAQECNLQKQALLSSERPAELCKGLGAAFGPGPYRKAWRVTSAGTMPTGWRDSQAVKDRAGPTAPKLWADNMHSRRSVCEPSVREGAGCI